MLTGGLLGVFFLVSTMVLGPKLGAGMTFAAIVSGQMIASLIFDQTGAIGFPFHAITPPRVLGACLIVAGVVLIARG
jgi:transporter family-2 protein